MVGSMALIYMAANTTIKKTKIVLEVVKDANEFQCPTYLGISTQVFQLQPRNSEAREPTSVGHEYHLAAEISSAQINPLEKHFKLCHI